MTEFDEFARIYEQSLERPCAVSGEDPQFYAVERLKWLSRRLPGESFETILDFGCGIGGSIRHFFEILNTRQVIGVDPSAESLQVARERYPDASVSLFPPEDYRPAGNLPFAFCNGVFHHIGMAERTGALAYVNRCLRRGGLFAFWENNPWNPAVVYSMSLNAFDNDARRLSVFEAKRLLRAAGFSIEFVDFCFFFPHFAQAMRPLEPALRWLPLGAQYLVLARKR